MKTSILMVLSILFLFSEQAHSQGNWYQQKLSKIDSLINEGLSREALSLYDSVYQRAFTEKNNVALVQTIVGRNKYIYSIEEQPLVAIIERLQADVFQLDAPVKQIVHSLIAEIYWGYYQQNRWRFHQRTAMEEPKGYDIRTWDLERLVAGMLGHLERSLWNEAVLQNTPVESYSALLDGDSLYRHLRPSLYDLLAHRALQLIANPEMGLSKPVDAFTLNHPAFFAPADEFAFIGLNTSDTLSLRYRSISIYQKLAQFRLGEKNIEALTDLELNRIEYLFSNSNHPQKEALTIAFYEQLLKKELPYKSKAEVMYRLALFYRQQQKQGDNEYLENSIALCNEVLGKYEHTLAATFCKSLKEEIERPFLNMSAEAYELPNQPFRVLLTWKNLKKAHFKLYRINSNKAQDFLQSWNFHNDSLDSLVPIRTWEQTLPGFNDYLEHRAEFPVEALKNGFYFLVASDSPNKKDQTHQVTSLVQITSLSVMGRNTNKGQLIAVNNAQIGVPVPKVKVTLFKREYNNSTRKWELEAYKKKTTNPDGEVVFKTDEKHFSGRIMAALKSDTILLGDRYMGSFDDFRKEKKQRSIVFYTDRAIYRPGQTVHFKGLVLDKKAEKTEIVAKHKETVVLKDVNGQDIGSLSVVSNDYGTFSGSFTLPRSGLNGVHQLTCSFGWASFRVEEYRRPTFEVLFNKPDHSFSFGDTVSLAGSVKTFSGTPVDEAKITWHVTRREQSIWWWRPALPEKVIESSETIAGQDGQFVLKFIDSGNDIDDRKRIMVYEIVAEATDRNGETQTNRFNIRISETNLIVECNLPTTVHSGRFEGVVIKASNLDGKPVQSNAKVRVTRLKPPKTTLVERYWETPDAFFLDEKTYRKMFPNYPYRDEHQPENWERRKAILRESHELPHSGKLQFTDWMASGPGYYWVEIEVASPDGKQKAKWERAIRVVAEKPAKSGKTDDWVTSIKTSCEPGEMAEIWLTALHPKSPVRYELVRGTEILKSEMIVPGKKVHRLLIPIEESYRGNITAQFAHVAHNRRYTASVPIEVPHTDKLIDIRFTTFRDLLLPGEAERWGLTLTDHTGKGIAAEMAATLYDASLDQFVKHNWRDNFLYFRYNNLYSWDNNYQQRLAKNSLNTKPFNGGYLWTKQFETMPLLNFNPGGYMRIIETVAFADDRQLDEVVTVGYGSQQNLMVRGMATKSQSVDAMNEALPIMMDDVALAFQEDAPPRKGEEGAQEQLDFSKVLLRANFNETAFFYPHLYSDDNGKLELSFTIPEAITRWRMLGFAHTKDFKHGTIENELVTRKLVSISAYAPRFLRESDTLEISAKIANLTGEAISGTALLQWTDAVSFEARTQLLIQGDSLVPFSAEANSSTVATWKVVVPAGLQAVTYKVMAQAGNHSDGEQKTLPVLTNRQLVTESLPFMVRGVETKELRFEKMANPGSTTLVNHSYTIEYTSNPAWYAIQALPYLMEYPYECAEQVFSRLYANAASSALVNSSPRIKAVFDAWKTIDAGAFLSNLEKNSELKSVLLKESPWLLNAKSESEAKQRIGLLFDLNRMGNELDAALRKLQKMQLSNGGFPWFAGMPDNRYITQHIAKGMGEMKQIKIVAPKWESEWETMRRKAMEYLDARIVEDYKELLKQQEKDSTTLAKYQPSMLQLHYLYTRSFYPDEKPGGETKTAFDYYLSQAKKHWLAYGEYAHGLLALTCHRFGDAPMAARIVKSLANRAIRSSEDGMYWKDNRWGYFWYQASIETQALLINVFAEVANDTVSVEEMKIWLLRNKQTTHWKTTKATLAACYALLSQGYNLLDESRPIAVKVAGQALEQLREIKPEAGTGYVKTAFSASEIEPAMANISVSNPNRGVAWGAAYWQYFEQLDKITSAKTDVEIRKQLFIKEKSGPGTKLKTIGEGSPVKVGDEVVVRVEIRIARDMEYVHLKDLRAAGFEPTSTLSGYHWQDGLGYYQEVKDAAVNFFIGYLRKGTYVFEYSLRASHAGQFSNGITTLQCMYAPEFTTHSSGGKVSIMK